MRKTLFTCLILSLLATVVHAQPSVDRVPGDAFVYIGWAGTEQLGPAYQNSKLKKFIAATTFNQIMEDTLPALLKKAGDEKPENADHVKAAQAIAQVMMRRPCAFYVAGLGAKDKTEDDEPIVRLGVIVQPGADKDTLMSALEHLKKQVPADEEMKLNVVTDGDSVGILMTNDAKASPFATGGKLSGVAAFTAAKQYFVADSALTIYFDAEEGLARLDANIKAEDDQQATDGWTKFLEASGLKGFRRLVMSAGFTKDEWLSQTFIDAPAPRKGIVKLFEPKPMDDGLLARVPTDVTSAGVVNFDFAQLIATVREIATAVDPQAGKQVQQGLGAGSMAIGRRIEGEILAPLGSQWALYTSPGQGAESVMGMIAVNKLDDEKLAKAAWADLYFAASNTLPNLMKRQGVTIVPTADDQIIPGGIVYSFKVSTIPAVPCFTFHNGFMYVGVDPTVLVKAATAADSKKLTEQPALAAMLKSIEAPATLTGFRYSDLAATGIETANDLEMVWPMLVDKAKEEGIPLPERLLPPSKDLQPLLGPALAVSWMDDKGFYSRDRSPFPGASSFGYMRGDETVMVGVSALGVSILLPSLNKARETANRVKCQSNMSQIGKGILLYSNENKGAAPPDLGKLVTDEDLTAEVFVCPSGTTSKPPAGTPQEQAKWVNENSDYVLIQPGVMVTKLEADIPMVYEKLNHHDKDGINILYADGHCEFQVMKAALDELKKAGVNDPVKAEKKKKKSADPNAPKVEPKPDPAKEPGM